MLTWERNELRLCVVENYLDQCPGGDFGEIQFRKKLEEWF